MFFNILFLCLFLALMSVSSCSSPEKIDKLIVDSCVEPEFLEKAETFLNSRRRRSLPGSVFDHLRKGCSVPKALPKPQNIIRIPIVSSMTQSQPDPGLKVINIPVVYPPNTRVIPLIAPDLSFMLYSGSPTSIGPFISNLSRFEDFVGLCWMNSIPVHPMYLFIPTETSDYLEVLQTSNGARAIEFNFSCIYFDSKLNSLGYFLKKNFEIQRSILAIVLKRANNGVYRISILFKKSASICITNIRRLLTEALGEIIEFIIWNDNIHL